MGFLKCVLIMCLNFHKLPILPAQWIYVWFSEDSDDSCGKFWPVGLCNGELMWFSEVGWEFPRVLWTIVRLGKLRYTFTDVKLDSCLHFVARLCFYLNMGWCSGSFSKHRFMPQKRDKLQQFVFTGGTRRLVQHKLLASRTSGHFVPIAAAWDGDGDSATAWCEPVAAKYTH